MTSASETAAAGLSSTGPMRQEDLAYRLHQQHVVAEFGRMALEASTLDDLLDAAVQLCAEGMGAQFSKAAEFLPDRNVLRVRAGVGWKPGVVGREILDIGTSVDYAFRTGAPVITEHPADGLKFHSAPIWAEHGIKRTLVVPVPLGAGRSWGTLGTDSPDESGRWDEADVEFMTGMARLLGVAIERQEAMDARERMHRLQEALPTSHLVLAPDFTIEEASESFCEATATRREDFVGKNIFEAFAEAPDGREMISWSSLRASLERVLATRAPDRMRPHRHERRCPNGEIEARWWAVLNVPVLGPDGAVRHIIHAVEDVTAEMLERERAAEVRIAEAQFRRVADAIPALVFETDLQGRNIFVNEQYRAYTGLPLEALLGDGWRQTYHPDDLAQALQAWEETTRTGRSYFEFECRIRRADGVWRWFVLRISILRNADGTSDRGIGACSDITERREAAEAQRTLLQSLRDSEELFRDLADSVPQLVWIADGEGSVYWYNRNWHRYTGMSAEEAAGWGWLKPIHPDHADHVVGSVQRALETGELFEDIFPIRSAGGRYRWFISRALPLKDEEGRATRWFGTNTDVTEQLEAQELLRTLLKEVSHRVKNSLALVSSLLKLQARTLGSDARHALEEASLRVVAVASVHDQLWRSAESREIDLQPFLSDLCSSIAEAAPRHETVWRIEPAIVSTEMAVPLGLFINELLTNAYKYVYPDGEEGEVRILGTHEPEGRYRLEVSDSGRGLPADFDPAEMGKEGKSLGMKVITSLATQLGGELITSPPGPGASFCLVFPLSPSGDNPIERYSKLRISHFLHELRLHNPNLSDLLLKPLLAYLLTARKASGGDLEMTIILIMIAIRAVEHPDFSKLSMAERLEEATVFPSNGVNTTSIAQSSGIPLETVRRKVEKLVGQGWIVRRGRNLHFTAKAFRELKDARDAGELLAVRYYDVLREEVSKMGEREAARHRA
jgi:PAS domain S-box-containing protein